ncbi:hypothetical protein J2X36_001594 [Methylobacterium sp. BE186]|uniref:hypothetical protein n=1 Tax=Methylobacterium sp. BE186 TaxID=2817715 RepID=UPI002865549D|nr:hypothetical protein [Methylobacterium sp. BE186]MDR7036852.1 hypothetical protein [Methylobacterium sp. BE186]
MSAFFGSDGSFVLQFAIIFVVILVVLTGIVLLGRRFLGGSGLSASAKAGGRGRQPRLGIVDVYELDRQRQLILLRRDNVEHLLLVGGPNDVVIERHIQRGLRGETAFRPEPIAEAPSEIEAQRGEPLFEPAFEMPVIVPGPDRAPPVSVPVDEAGFVPAPEGPQGDPATLPLPPEAPPRRPDAAPKRSLSRTTPPLINPRPDVASERARTEPEFTATSSEPPSRGPEPATPPTPATPAVPPPVSAPSEPRTIDANILSDMARQLEIALSRPSSGVTPPPAAPVQPRPASPAEAAPKPRPPAPPSASAIDPMAAAMAASQEAPVGEPAQTPQSKSSEPAAVGPADPKPFLPEPPPAAPPPSAPPPAPQPVPEAPPATKPTQAATPAPAQKPAAANNPFSVEEIEAEFARLLGRPLDKKN